MSDENSKWFGHERKGYYPQNHPEKHLPKVTMGRGGYEVTAGGYTMPALKTEVFFWQQAEDLRKLLTKDKYVASFFEKNPNVPDSPETRAAAAAFGKWILSVAEKAAQNRLAPGKGPDEAT